MEETLLDRWARAEKRRIAGMSGQPEFRIEVEITAQVAHEELLPPPDLAPLFEETKEASPDRVVRPTVSQLDVSPRVRDWIKLAREIAGEKGIDVRELWVRVDVRPESKCVTYTTHLSTMVLAYRDPKVVAGRLRLFIRFAAFAKVVDTDQISQFAIVGTKLNYVSGGEAKTLEAVDRVHSDAFTPDAPPLTGYKLVKDLGLALREASYFTKKKADVMGRHKILVFPRRDSLGTIDVIGCGGTVNEEQAGIALIYKREVVAPDLTTDLYLEPMRALSSDQVLPDTVGFTLAGSDFVWLLCDTGFIVGLESAPSAAPDQADLDRALQAPNGRIEFVDEEIAALRRAVAQLRIDPDTMTQKEVLIRPRGQSRYLEFGTQNKLQSVTCSGDMGPDTISVNPDLLAHALSVRGVRAIEFDKQDGERCLLMVGPGVRVALKPLEAVK